MKSVENICQKCDKAKHGLKPNWELDQTCLGRRQVFILIFGFGVVGLTVWRRTKLWFAFLLCLGLYLFLKGREVKKMKDG